MESNPLLLNLGIKNEGLAKQSLSDEKLELRLGLPSTEVHYRKLGYGDDEGFSRFRVERVVKIDASSCDDDDTTFQSCSHKRAAPSSVIGWPPVNSFRKKISASSNNTSFKPSSSDPQSKEEDKIELKLIKDPTSEIKEQMFVKINMEGVPIGRKVNLRKYDNYESLSSAVDQLFRGLLAAQEGNVKMEERKEITGLLDGSSEYTLVYEDNEGDRVLVGDVPWNMFLSTVKRLRVLKSSNLGSKHG